MSQHMKSTYTIKMLAIIIITFTVFIDLLKGEEAGQRLECLN